MNKTLLLIASLVLISCGPQTQKIEVSVPFDRSAAAYINKKGTAKISGQAFLRRRGGGVVTCAGQNVYLFPATDYANERMMGIYGTTGKGYRSAKSAGYNEAESEDYYSYNRQTTCDAEGDFEFSGVADGDYYVTASVLWQVNDYYYEGGNLMESVSIRNGKSAKVLMSQ